MSEIEQSPVEVPRGINQLRLSEQVGLDRISQFYRDEDTFDAVAKAVRAGYERKWQRMQPIQPRQHRPGGPLWRK